MPIRIFLEIAESRLYFLIITVILFFGSFMLLFGQGDEVPGYPTYVLKPTWPSGLKMQQRLIDLYAMKIDGLPKKNYPCGDIVMDTKGYALMYPCNGYIRVQWDKNTKECLAGYGESFEVKESLGKTCKACCTIELLNNKYGGDIYENIPTCSRVGQRSYLYVLDADGIHACAVDFGH